MVDEQLQEKCELTRYHPSATCGLSVEGANQKLRRSTINVTIDPVARFLCDSCFRSHPAAEKEGAGCGTQLNSVFVHSQLTSNSLPNHHNTSRT
jgi:hypothetical protein